VSPSLMIPRLGIQIPRRAILRGMINRRFYWTAVPDVGRWHPRNGRSAKRWHWCLPL